MRRQRAALGAPLAVLWILFLLMLAGAGPATAHGDDGAMDVLASRQAGPAAIYVEVSIPYADGDVATDAIVTATLTGPGGENIADVPVPRSGSASPSYAAEVAVPQGGVWRIALRSTQPVAEATVEVAVDDGRNRATAADGGPIRFVAAGATLLAVALLLPAVRVRRRRATSGS